MRCSINPTVLISLLPLLTALTNALPTPQAEDSIEAKREAEPANWNTPYSQGESNGGHGTSSWNSGPYYKGPYSSGSTPWKEKRDEEPSDEEKRNAEPSQWDTAYSQGESNGEHGSSSWNSGPYYKGPYSSGSTSWKRDVDETEKRDPEAEAEADNWNTPYSQGESNGEHGSSSWNSGPYYKGPYSSGSTSWKEKRDAEEDAEKRDPEASNWNTPYSKGESNGEHGYSSWNSPYSSGTSSWKEKRDDDVAEGDILEDDNEKRDAEASNWNTPYSQGESNGAHRTSSWNSGPYYKGPYSSGSTSWKRDAEEGTGAGIEDAEKRDADANNWSTPYSEGESNGEHGHSSWNSGPYYTGPYSSGSTSWKE